MTFFLCIDRCFERSFKHLINNSNNRLKCEKTLQLEGYSNVYAIGDCADVGPMRAYFAELQGQTVGENIIKQYRLGGRMKPTEWKQRLFLLFFCCCYVVFLFFAVVIINCFCFFVFFSSANPTMFVPLGKDGGASQVPAQKGKVVDAKLTSIMKGKHLQINDAWTNMNYKKELSTIDWQNIQINGHLLDSDISRLAKACKMDEFSFASIIGRDDLKFKNYSS